MSLFKVRPFWSLQLANLISTSGTNKQSDFCDELQGRHNIDDLNDDDYQSSKANQGDWIFCLGNFNSIGLHDVFICANSNGTLCIVQVPQSNQRINNNSTFQEEEIVLTETTNIAERQVLALHRMSNCDVIIDIKCGYFLSTTKQSIAVLTANEIIFFHVKKRHPSSLNEDQDDNDDQDHKSNSSNNINDLIINIQADNDNKSHETLMSHKLEERLRLDKLIWAELPAKLVVIGEDHSMNKYGLMDMMENDHYHSIENSSIKLASGKKSRSRATRSAHSDHQSNQQQELLVTNLQSNRLQTRDLIIVQYTNQLLFTLIENKKIIAHYGLKRHDFNYNNRNIHNQQHDDTQTRVVQVVDETIHQSMGQYLGSMPMVGIYQANNAISLILSLSDYTIYSISLSVLLDLAKQITMKKVTQNLIVSNLADKAQNKLIIDINDNDSNSDNNNLNGDIMSKISIVDVDIEKLCDWSVESACAPIEFATIRRSLGANEQRQLRKRQKHEQNMSRSASTVQFANRNKSKQNKQHDNQLGQQQQQQEGQKSLLLVMFRYQLDLYTNYGIQLWSIKLESPIVSFNSYVVTHLPTIQSSDEDKSGKISHDSSMGQNKESIISLIYCDCLAQNKLDMLIFNENHTIWSASLESGKQLQLYRANLSSIPSSLVSLEAQSGLLQASYLGTSCNNSFDDNQQIAAYEQNQDLLMQNITKLEFLREDEIKYQQKQQQKRPFDEGKNNTYCNESNELVDLIQDHDNGLILNVRQEAFQSWPNVKVRCKLRIDPGKYRMLHNIIVSIEFDQNLRLELISVTNNSIKQRPNLNDDKQQQLIEFQSNEPRQLINIRLGNYWPTSNMEQNKLIDKNGLFELQFDMMLASVYQKSQSNFNRFNDDDNDNYDIDDEKENFGEITGNRDSNYATLQSITSSFNCLKNLQVKLFLHYNEPEHGLLLQEKTFNLPLNMIAGLRQIEYITNEQEIHTRTFRDQLMQLDGYITRSNINKDMKHTNIEQQQDLFFGQINDDEHREIDDLPHFQCDIIQIDTKNANDLSMIQFIDYFLECDLFCRDFIPQAKRMNSNLLKSTHASGSTAQETMEKLSMLSLSLDCRLKFKSVSPNHNFTGSQAESMANIDESVNGQKHSLHMVSIGLKLYKNHLIDDPYSKKLLSSNNGDDDIKLAQYSMIINDQDDQTSKSKNTTSTVWIHFIDLAQGSNNGQIAAEFLQQHAKNWKSYEKLIIDDKSNADFFVQSNEIVHKQIDNRFIISIECQSVSPILIVQNQLIQRLQELYGAASVPKTHIDQLTTNICKLTQLSEYKLDLMQVKWSNVFKFQMPTICISVNLHDKLAQTLQQFKIDVDSEVKQIKADLKITFCKYNLSSKLLLSLAKRLSNLPPELERQFDRLSNLIKHYQLSLQKLLSDMQKLKSLNDEYAQIPNASDIYIEQPDRLVSWPMDIACELLL